MFPLIRESGTVKKLRHPTFRIAGAAKRLSGAKRPRRTNPGGAVLAAPALRATGVILRGPFAFGKRAPWMRSAQNRKVMQAIAWQFHGLLYPQGTSTLPSIYRAQLRGATATGRADRPRSRAGREGRDRAEVTPTLRRGRRRRRPRQLVCGPVKLPAVL
jgi:hypothetical protein